MGEGEVRVTVIEQEKRIAVLDAEVCELKQNDVLQTQDISGLTHDISDHFVSIRKPPHRAQQSFSLVRPQLRAVLPRLYGLYGSFSPGLPYMGTYPVSPHMYCRTLYYAYYIFTSFLSSPFVCDRLRALFPSLSCKTKHNLSPHDLLS